jgi:molecular chaperone GrpE
MPERNRIDADSRQIDESDSELAPTTEVSPLPADSLTSNASLAEQPESGSDAHNTPSHNLEVDRFDRLSTAVQSISTQLDALTNIVHTRLSYDKVKEETFERLYADLDQFKRNAAQENIKPVLFDLLLLYDRMELAIRGVATGKDNDGAIAIEIVKSFIDELLEVLYRRDVGLIAVPSATFDSSQQRAIGVENVSDPAQDQLVATVVRRGFQIGNRVLRPEEVIVKKYMNPITNASSGECESTKLENDSSDG